tara:strand:- start:205 stop:798 length:594 start_codon:yes stop_codon:yes gene_type:complete
MIPIRALSAFVLKMALDSAKEEIKEEAKRKILEAQFPAVKALIAEQVANSYTEYVKDLSLAYIESVASMEAEVGFEEGEQEKLVIIAENAIKELEVFLDKQSQDGPIISFIKRRYEEEGIRKITGNLYAGNYIRKQSEGVYKIYNRMAYAPLVDKNKPWLSSDKTSQGIGDIIAEKANEIFEKAFDVDLSEDDILRS